jgi:hypothetical protein
MIRKWIAVAAGAILLGALSIGCSSDQKSTDAKPVSYEKSVSGSVSAKVKSIDHASREVTLQGDKGNEETFTVARSVKRLDEVKPGDTVKVDYQATLSAELRPATPEEKEHPIALLGATGRAPSTTAPAAGAGRALRIVTTVEAVDVSNMLVTLRGPLGDLAVVKGRNPENVKKLRVGDTVVITYTEAAVVSLVKAGQ